MTINLPNLSGALPPRRPGAPRGNKNAVGYGAPRGNKNGLGHGAPRGNRNAVKFGVYTRAFARPIVRPPGLSLIETLELEEHRLRLYVRDEIASVTPAGLDFRSSLSLLRAATIAVGRIERLHRRIFAIRNSHAFDSELGRSIARELHLFPTHEQESALLPSPVSPLPSSVSQNNCLLVPLFSNIPDLSNKSDLVDVPAYRSGFQTGQSDVSDVPVVGHAWRVTNPERRVHDNLESDVPACRSGFQTGQSDVSDVPIAGHAWCVTDQELTKQPSGGLLDLNRQILAPHSKSPPQMGQTLLDICVESFPVLE